MNTLVISNASGSSRVDWLNVWLFQGLLFLVLFLIIAARRPDILTNAQPWAEDGFVWMTEIYTRGFWSSVLLPQNGYYQTLKYNVDLQ